MHSASNPVKESILSTYHFDGSFTILRSSDYLYSYSFKLASFYS